MLWPTMLKRVSRSPAGVGQRLQRLVQAARGLHEVAPPVEGEHVVDEARARPSSWPAEARRLQQLEEVVVLREPEHARQAMFGAQQRARPQVVAALAEGEHEGQAQVVLADGVAEVEPDARLVRPRQAAAHDAGDDHGGRNVLVARARPGGCRRGSTRRRRAPSALSSTMPARRRSASPARKGSAPARRRRPRACLHEQMIAASAARPLTGDAYARP